MQFKMAAAADQLHSFCGRKILMSEIIQFKKSHFPRYENVEVIFSRFYWKLKWPPQVDFLIICEYSVTGVVRTKMCKLNVECL